MHWFAAPRHRAASSSISRGCTPSLLRVLHQQSFEPRLLADWVPNWVELQQVDTERRRLPAQSLDLVERPGVAELCQDLCATHGQVRACKTVLSIDARLLKPSGLAKRFVTTTESSQCQSTG